MRKRFFLILILVVVLGGSGVFFMTRHQTPAQDSLTTPVRGMAVDAVYATGEVELATWAALSPQITGQVEGVRVVEGTRVAAGDILVQLDASVERHQREQLAATLVYLQQDLRRQQNLGRDNYASRQRIEDLTSQVAATTAAIAAQDALLQRLSIKAPFAGVVIRRDVEPGETIKQGDPVIWVGDPASLRITAEVDEEDIARVTPGHKVLLTADAFPEQVFVTTVGEITPKGDPLNKNFRVRMPLAADSPLKPGMTVEANIILREVDNALLIPATAVQDGRVYRVTGSRTTPVAVRIGIAGGTMVQVLDGIDAGDRILKQAPRAVDTPGTGNTP